MRRLKFKLDRESLKTIYLTFIRPPLEYGDVIWDNCTQYEKNELDKIQNEAARITTGTTKLVSLDNLYKEVGWQTLHRRRQDHKITFFYKTFYQLTPIYLSSLIPQQVNAISGHKILETQMPFILSGLTLASITVLSFHRLIGNGTAS